MDTARKCPSCGEEKPLVEECFHRDASRDPPWSALCKTCIAAERKGKGLALRQEKLELARQRLLMDTLGAAIRNPQAPHTAELVERIYARFGGVDGFVEEFHTHFQMTEPGGAQRTRMLDQVIRLTAQNVTLGGAKKPLDYYSREELEEEAARLAAKLMPRIDVQVIDAEVVDSDD